MRTWQSDSAMCGQKTYNNIDDLCCNNARHVNARREGKECCNPGTEVYTPDTDDCCDGVVQLRTTTGRSIN